MDGHLIYLKNELREYISKKGLRNTSERYIILKSIVKEEDSFTIGDLMCCDELNDICQATVYNTISLLTNAGIVERIPTTSDKSEYRLVKDILVDNER